MFTSAAPHRASISARPVDQRTRHRGGITGWKQGSHQPSSSDAPEGRDLRDHWNRAARQGLDHRVATSLGVGALYQEIRCTEQVLNFGMRSRAHEVDPIG
jgi:hypothetical protein